MRLIFAPSALTEIKNIHSHIAEENPLAADRVRDAILSGATLLLEFPEKGRRGVVDGTRARMLVAVLLGQVG